MNDHQYIENLFANGECQAIQYEKKKNCIFSIFNLIKRESMAQTQQYVTIKRLRVRVKNNTLHSTIDDSSGQLSLLLSFFILLFYCFVALITHFYFQFVFLSVLIQRKTFFFCFVWSVGNTENWFFFLAFLSLYQEQMWIQ